MNLLDFLIRKEAGPQAALKQHEAALKSIVKEIQSSTRFPIVKAILSKNESLSEKVTHASSTLDAFSSTVVELAAEQKETRNQLLGYCSSTAEETTSLLNEPPPEASPGIPPLDKKHLSNAAYLSSLPEEFRIAVERNDERMKKLIQYEKSVRKGLYLNDAHGLLRVFTATTNVLERIADILVDDARHYAVVIPAQVKLVEHAANLQAIARTTHLVRTTTETIYGRAFQGLYLARDAYRQLQLPASTSRGFSSHQPFLLSNKKT